MVRVMLVVVLVWLFISDCAVACKSAMRTPNSNSGLLLPTPSSRPTMKSAARWFSHFFVTCEVEVLELMLVCVPKIVVKKPLGGGTGTNLLDELDDAVEAKPVAVPVLP